MKRKLNYIPIVALLVLTSSCATIQKGNDPIVVRAEQSVNQADLTFHLFVTSERAHKADLAKISPQFNIIANKIRRDGLHWLDSAQNAIAVYKGKRTAENQANMNTYVQLVKQLLAEAETYIPLSAGKIPTPPEA